ncbi:hypothetical protein B566_EDAN015911 [Ephemera danica]|nr:hypothetical protein B566_EDAN015911 [Ephemera danica]
MNRTFIRCPGSRLISEELWANGEPDNNKGIEACIALDLGKTPGLLDIQCFGKKLQYLLGGRSWNPVCSLIPPQNVNHSTRPSVFNENAEANRKPQYYTGLLLFKTIPQRATLYRNLHTSSWLLEKEPLKPSSKVEATVEKLKEDLKTPTPVPTSTDITPVVKKSMWEKVKDEARHYYHGFRLLFIDINISRKLIFRVLNGKTLTRREHRQLVRTVSDLFRLVPFSVFIIVPFMELLLPLAVKLFPGMLPSTFQTTRDKEDKMKQALKVKLEMAKFLQQTLDNMSLQSKGHHSEAAKNFAEFFEQMRTSGQQASTEQIMKFSKLFEDEITLDSLSRAQLSALCRVLEIQPLGTNNFLRFQLRMKLRSLAADDKMITKEGVETLTFPELQQACRARGMRSYGMPESRLRAQLSQWLDLSMNERVPPSLLLLSRALLLPETISASEQIKATISVLSDTAVTQAKAAIGEREGKVDNKTKIELIKAEEQKIREERQERRQEEAQKKQEAVVAAVSEATPSVDETVLEASMVHAKAAEQLIAEAISQKDLSSKDFVELEDALESVSKDKRKLIVEKEELEDLKEEMADYQEDLEDLKVVTSSAKVEVKESKAAKALYRRVDRMINNMDAVLSELEKEKAELASKLEAEKAGPVKERKYKSQNIYDVCVGSEELVSIADLMDAIRQIQKVPDASKLQRISDVLGKIDDDRDGSIRVIELIGKDNVKLSAKQVDEILELLDKEEVLEIEAQIDRKLESKHEQKSGAQEATKASAKVATSQVPSDPHEVTPRQQETVALASKPKVNGVQDPTKPNNTSQKL